MADRKVPVFLLFLLLQKLETPAVAPQVAVCPAPPMEKASGGFSLQAGLPPSPSKVQQVLTYLVVPPKFYVVFLPDCHRNS